MRSDYLYNVGDVIEVKSGKVKIIEREGMPSFSPVRNYIKIIIDR